METDEDPSGFLKMENLSRLLEEVEHIRKMYDPAKEELKQLQDKVRENKRYITNLETDNYYDHLYSQDFSLMRHHSSFMWRIHFFWNIE